MTTEDDANVPSYIVLEQGDLYYAQDGTGNLAKGTEDPTIRNVYNEEGELTGTQEIPSDDKTITDNTLFGSAAKDKIDGKTGNDLIAGLGGNDVIEGGTGDDMIGGGAGEDYISSSVTPHWHRTLNLLRSDRPFRVVCSMIKTAFKPNKICINSSVNNSKINLHTQRSIFSFPDSWAVRNTKGASK